MERKWIHVVVRGDRVGIFSSWREYACYVVRKSRAVSKKFETTQEACDFIAQNLDEGEVELQHIHTMVELIRTLTPNSPYVPKKKEATDANKGANDFCHGFQRPFEHWEKGQSSSTPHAFKPAHSFSGLLKVDCMDSRQGNKLFEAYPSGALSYEPRPLRSSGLLGMFCGFCFVIMFFIILILAVLLVLICKFFF